MAAPLAPAAWQPGVSDSQSHSVESAWVPEASLRGEPPPVVLDVFDRDTFSLRQTRSLEGALAGTASTAFLTQTSASRHT